jgi:hypothetical protein
MPECGCHPKQRTFDPDGQISLFGKLKLASCALSTRRVRAPKFRAPPITTVHCILIVFSMTPAWSDARHADEWHFGGTIKPTAHRSAAIPRFTARRHEVAGRFRSNDFNATGIGI